MAVAPCSSCCRRVLKGRYPKVASPWDSGPGRDSIRDSPDERPIWPPRRKHIQQFGPFATTGSPGSPPESCLLVDDGRVCADLGLCKSASGRTPPGDSQVDPAWQVSSASGRWQRTECRDGGQDFLEQRARLIHLRGPPARSAAKWGNSVGREKFPSGHRRRRVEKTCNFSRFLARPERFELPTPRSVVMRSAANQDGCVPPQPPVARVSSAW